MRPFSIFAALILLIPLSIATSSSENYGIQATITGGGDDTSSSSYSQTVVIGAISGIMSSQTFSSDVGFLHTVRLANGSRCTQDTQCEGSFCCAEVCQSTACGNQSNQSSGGGDSGGGGGSSGTGGSGGSNRGGGGGGWSNGTALKPSTTQLPNANFTLLPELVTFNLSLGEEDSSYLTIQNTGTDALDAFLSVNSISEFISITPNSIQRMGYLGKKEIAVTALGRSLGAHYGQITATSSNLNKTSDVILNVESNQALFDVQLDIPSSFKWLSENQNPRAQLTLFNIGPAPQVEVTITYIIKDTNGITFSEESETFYVEKEKSFVHEFLMPNLPLGKYIAIAEMRYQGEFAVSSDIFSVTKKDTLGVIKDLSSRNLTFFVALLVISGVAYIALGYFNPARKRQSRIKPSNQKSREQKK